MAAADIVPFQMKPGTTLNPNGRPKSKTRQLIEELEKEGIHGLSPTDVKGIYEQLIDSEQAILTRITNDPKQPMAARIAAKQLLGNRGWEIVKDMLDRAHGKATLKAEVEQKTEMKVSYKDMTDEELENIIGD